MKVGFTGTRHGMTASQIVVLTRLLEKKGFTDLHHGDCVGADAQARDMAKLLGLWIVSHPPVNPGRRARTENDETREPLPYMIRNQAIIDETDHMFAAPHGMKKEQRSGTWATIQRSRSVTIIFPDGTYEERGKMK